MISAVGPVTFSKAIDAYIGHLARTGRSQATRNSYRRLLNDFADVVRDKPPAELELADYEQFLDRWTDSSPSTLASGVSLVRKFSRFLYERGWSETFVAEPLQRPGRKRSEDLDVVTVSSEDVLKLLDACEDWQEFLCVTTAVCTAGRRAALARAAVTST
jgi:site-specific recombinase XerD